VSAALDQDTIPVREGEAPDAEALAAYLRGRLPEVPDAPLQVRQFPSGASNLTYLVRAGGWEAVRRPPPLGPVPPKAHDMPREAAILRRLHPVFPLAPEPYLVCDDPAVLGAPFYLMERRRGVVLDQAVPPALRGEPELGRRVAEGMVDTLVRLHAVDYRAAGLEALGRPEGFLERQAAGWIGRWEHAATETIAQVEPLARWLAANVPASPAATLIHNDFKLNNLLLDPDDPGRVTAVLDWEMATVGDPLFDLAVSLGYWVEAADPAPLRALLPTVSVLPGFPPRAELVRRYAERSGRDVGALGWYLTFAYFKLAVIVQQIHARWARGQTRDPRFASFGERARTLVVHAHTLAGLAPRSTS
jgi:aminoglycoside phosphotransferase (APT) family kinase protein